MINFHHRPDFYHSKMLQHVTVKYFAFRFDNFFVPPTPQPHPKYLERKFVMYRRRNLNVPILSFFCEKVVELVFEKKKTVL